MTRLNINVLVILFVAAYLIHSWVAAQETATRTTIQIRYSDAVSLNRVRQSAVSNAWKQERILVQETGRGTRLWTIKEIQELLATGKVKGIEGHHINDASTHPQLAGDPNNIKFVKGKQGHLNEHRGNFRNTTHGRFISRQRMLQNYHWSVSNQNLLIGGSQLFGGVVLIRKYLPETLTTSEVYLRGGQQDSRLLWEAIDSSLFVGSGVAFSISGSARIAAYAIGKAGISQMHFVLGPLRMTSRIAGPAAVLLLVTESGVYTYRWKQGYLSTPTFVKRMGVASSAVGGAILGGKAGASIGNTIVPIYGGIAGGAIGTFGGGIGGAIVATSFIENHYAGIDEAQQDEFLDHLYSFYGQKRKHTSMISR